MCGAQEKGNSRFDACQPFLWRGLPAVLLARRSCGEVAGWRGGEMADLSAVLLVRRSCGEVAKWRIPRFFSSHIRDAVKAFM